MKNLQNENYYELLELTPRATSDQIQQAYEHARKTFSEDSMAVYSLFTAEDRKQLLERIEHAYRVLMNESARRQYDREIGLSHHPDPARTVQNPPHVDSSPFLESLPEPLTGKALKEIRERLGISLEEISACTRIHHPYLEFIERDRYDKLPHEVYLRGYLIQYAKMMGLDAARVVRGYLKTALGSLNKGS
jgi:flagellar biosynthesis protein FlhG